MKQLFFILSLIVLPIIFFSCEEKDNFSSDPNIRLEFSRDTVSFDTVFTSFGSSTSRLKVYNRSKNSVTISSIEIMNPDKSGFRMNVDGEVGDRIENVDLLKKDSLFIFIEVTVDPLNSDNPMLISDSIRFNVNGSTQYIYLEAIGQDVHLWTGKVIDKDTTLRAGKPFLIYDSLYVKEGVTLNIEKNVKLNFHSGAKMQIAGTLNSKGTLAEPVVFRADRYDNFFTTVPYDRIPGQWPGVIVDSTSFNNHFEYTHIRNSVKGVYFKPSDPSIKKATFLNSIVHNTSEDGIYAENCWIEGLNSQFSNAGGNVMKLVGGQYEFLHCTLANYMLWAKKNGKALSINNYVYGEGQDIHGRPLTKCSFINTIIAGSSSSEATLNKDPNNSYPFAHLFINCLIKASGKDDPNFIETVWNKDPDFKNINKDKNYYYNFELDSISPAIHMADRSYSIKLPYDMKGVYRLADNGPDIGCYEWVATEPE